ncbi:MAG: hypothetical protein HYY78_12855 [Betaproteobacteria bacterium]|nr:hypothetical protein [Betaproteobacteria bacterium]
MEDQKRRDSRFERLTGYFRASSFQYLAPSLGFVDVHPGRARFPEAGEHVAEGGCLFVIRRFKNGVEVRAAAAGALASVMVERGAFVEFGQPLATIDHSG